MLTVEQILTQLNTDDISFLPREAIEQAILQQDAITPALLDIIDGIAKDPNSIDDAPAYFYALYLLAQFREMRAYPLIVKYFGELGLDDETLDPTGDLVTEDLKSILDSVCNGDLGLIKQLIEDQNVNIFVRSAALSSLVILYNNNQLPRQDLVNYIETHIDLCLEEQDDLCFVACLVSVSCAIHPEELYEKLITCFDRNLIDKQMINEKDLDRWMQMDKEKVIVELKENRKWQFIEDVISEIEWWACFHPEKYSPKNLSSISDSPLTKVGRNDLCPCGSGKKYKKCCLH